MFDQKHHPGKSTLTQGLGQAPNSGRALEPGKKSRVEHELGIEDFGRSSTTNAKGREHAGHDHHHEQENEMTGAAVHPDEPSKHKEIADKNSSSLTGVNMTVLKEFISKHEGNVHYVYRDSLGNLTPGIGHLITSDHWHAGDKVSADQITEWFKQDVARAIEGAKQDIGPAYRHLNEARQMVVIDMAFNLGAVGLAGFHDTIQAIRAGSYAQAAEDMLHSRWATQVGHRATEDAAIMRSGHLGGENAADGETMRAPIGGVEAISDKRPFGGGYGPPHSRWSPAPSLEAVKDGTAKLHEGERGASVREVQRLLAIDVDGEFGPGTRAAVVDFQREHHEGQHDGVVDAHTLALMIKRPVGTIKGESSKGSAERQMLLDIARSNSIGRKPDGFCYSHVCDFLRECGGYGKIVDPRTQFPSWALPEAHDFAGLMHVQGPKIWGLERLSISNPYDAPAGTIVVVKAGSPGTSDPTAGDISIADGHGNFYNGGEMGYHGRAGWSASPNATLLGCYAPR